MRFTRVVVNVSDMDRSLGFYSEVLGLPVNKSVGNEEHKVAIVGNEGEAQIELIYKKDAAPQNPEFGKGVVISFGVSGLEDAVASIRSRLPGKLAGPISPNPNVTFYLLEDPDGNTIQIFE